MGRTRRRHRADLLAFGFALALCGGCAFGPRALEKTHGRYYESVRLVDEEELLRNLVHMRYNESPSSLNVSSIAAQYELAGSAEARPFFLAPNPSNSNVIFKTFTSILPDLMVSGANRPTISLVPGNDGSAVRKFLTPITADALVFLVQSGWPVSTILRLWVDRLNGVPNGSATLPCEPLPDFERFQKLVELMHHLAVEEEVLAVRAEEKVVERSGPLPAEAVTSAAAVEAAKNGLEYLPRGDGKTWVLVKKERRLVIRVTQGAESNPELLELEQLLNLVPGQVLYDLVVGTGRVPDPARHPREPSPELRVTPRSTAQVYLYLAHGVEVPDEHVRCGLACLPADTEGRLLDPRELTRGLFAVHARKGHKPPPAAYVAVQYRGWWYYIDDRDQPSKATFALMLQLSRLDFARQRLGGAPMLTLPVGR
ncbi:MAG TPA: hypothetical protein VFE78_14110 [Gemmataceae bacterium]|nr:hypothetical protein [Gemmataceae bacterium]